jgi:hypothetical protein
VPAVTAGRQAGRGGVHLIGNALVKKSCDIFSDQKKFLLKTLFVPFVLITCARSDQRWVPQKAFNSIFLPYVWSRFVWCFC